MEGGSRDQRSVMTHTASENQSIVCGEGMVVGSLGAWWYMGPTQKQRSVGSETGPS